MIKVRFEVLVSLMWIIIEDRLVTRSVDLSRLDSMDGAWLGLGLLLGIIWLWREAYGLALMVLSFMWGRLYFLLP